MTLEFWGTAAEILRTLQWRGEGGGWQEQCEMMSINTFFFFTRSWIVCFRRPRRLNFFLEGEH